MAPNLRFPGDNFIALKGETVTIPCKSTKILDRETRWLLSGDEIYQSDRVYITTTGVYINTNENFTMLNIEVNLIIPSCILTLFYPGRIFFFEKTRPSCFFLVKNPFREKLFLFQINLTFFSQNSLQLTLENLKLLR